MKNPIVLFLLSIAGAIALGFGLGRRSTASHVPKDAERVVLSPDHQPVQGIFLGMGKHRTFIAISQVSGVWVEAVTVFISRERKPEDEFDLSDNMFGIDLTPIDRQEYWMEELEAQLLRLGEHVHLRTVDVTAENGRPFVTGLF